MPIEEPGRKQQCRKNASQSMDVGGERAEKRHSAIELVDLLMDSFLAQKPTEVQTLH